jgi:hypothetical protein
MGQPAKMPSCRSKFALIGAHFTHIMGLSPVCQPLTVPSGLVIDDNPSRKFCIFSLSKFQITYTKYAERLWMKPAPPLAKCHDLIVLEAS